MKKKKFLFSFLGILVVLLAGLSIQNNSVNASVITLKASTKKSYYNVKSNSIASNNKWGDSLVSNNFKINHGKISYNYVPMGYVVKGKKAVYSYHSYKYNKNGGTMFKKNIVYLYRFPTHVTHLKPNQKYRFKTDADPVHTDYRQLHWVTKKTNSKGVLKYGPSVDVFLNAGKSKSYMKKLLKNKKRISNSRIEML